jgi:hypothetical protein
MKPQPELSTQEVLAGLVERVTYHNAENGFCVLRAKARGHRDVVTVVGEIPNHIDLSAEDRAQSTTRPNEEMWEQQVRNLISHRTTAGNIICEGYAEYTGNAIRITDAGRQYLRRI